MNQSDRSSTQPRAYLVTGGAGMLGQAVVSQLLERERDVRILDIEPAKNDRVEVMVGDIRDTAAVRKACEGMDTVIHAAAAVWDAQLPLGIYEDTNIRGTQVLIDTCMELGVPRFVYSSTLDVVMDGKTGHCMADESVPYPTDVKKMNRYAYSKMIGEQTVLRANGPGFSTCSMRIVGMYGPGDRYHLPNVLKYAQKGMNIHLGNGKAHFSHVFCGNAAHAHILAAENLAPGSPVAGQAYFVTDHHTGNFFEFMDPFLEQMGLRCRKVRIPYGLAYVLCWLVERFSSKSNFNRFTLYSTCVDHTYVHDKATRDFGYRPRFTPEQAFDITLDWLKTQKF